MPSAQPSENCEDEEDMEDDGEANESADIYEEIDQEEDEQNTSRGMLGLILDWLFSAEKFKKLLQWTLRPSCCFRGLLLDLIYF